MSRTVRGRIAGRPVRLLYDAAWIPLPAGGSRLARSRQVGRHLRQHRARAAGQVRVGPVEYWWAARESGLAPAAGILRWLHEDPGGGAEDATLAGERPRDCRILIPCDETVYLCTVVNGMIHEERFMVPEQAGEEIDHQDPAEPVYAWQIGPQKARGAAALETRIALEPAPFHLEEIRLRTHWVVLARQGLVHPRQLLLAGLGIAMVSLALSVPPVIRMTTEIHGASDPVQAVWGGIMTWLGFREAPEPGFEAPPLREIVPSVPHGAARALRRMSTWLVAAEELYADGIRRFEWSGSTLQLGGRAPVWQWPARAERLARDHGGHFDLGPEGWSVSLPLEHLAESLRPPQVAASEVIRHLTELPHALTFLAGPAALPSVVDPEAHTVTRELTRTDWRVDLTGTAVGELGMLANRLEGMPGALVRTTCQLGDYRLQSCEILLEIRSL